MNFIILRFIVICYSGSLSLFTMCQLKHIVKITKFKSLKSFKTTKILFLVMEDLKK